MMSYWSNDRNFLELIFRVARSGLVRYLLLQMIHDYSYKIVLIGDSSVGKSALLRRFADDSFEESYLATIGVDFRFKSLAVNGQQIKMQIWDTAGQERFRTITSAYYKGAAGILIVFDLLQQKSFENVAEFWLQQIARYGEADVQIAIVGNKADCSQTIDEEQFIEFAEKHKMSINKISAKSGEGVGRIFQDLAQRCVKQFGKNESEAKDKTRVIDDIRKKKEEFKLKSGQSDKNKKKCC